MMVSMSPSERMTVNRAIRGAIVRGDEMTVRQLIKCCPWTDKEMSTFFQHAVRSNQVKMLDLIGTIHAHDIQNLVQFAGRLNHREMVQYFLLKPGLMSILNRMHLLDDLLRINPAPLDLIRDVIEYTKDHEERYSLVERLLESHKHLWRMDLIEKCMIPYMTTDQKDFVLGDAIDSHLGHLFINFHPTVSVDTNFMADYIGQTGNFKLFSKITRFDLRKRSIIQAIHHHHHVFLSNISSGHRNHIDEYIRTAIRTGHEKTLNAVLNFTKPTQYETYIRLTIKAFIPSSLQVLLSRYINPTVSFMKQATDLTLSHPSPVMRQILATHWISLQPPSSLIQTYQDLCDQERSHIILPILSISHLIPIPHILSNIASFLYDHHHHLIAAPNHLKSTRLQNIFHHALSINSHHQIYDIYDLAHISQCHLFISSTTANNNNNNKRKSSDNNKSINNKIIRLHEQRPIISDLD